MSDNGKVIAFNDIQNEDEMGDTENNGIVKQNENDNEVETFENESNDKQSNDQCSVRSENEMKVVANNGIVKENANDNEIKINRDESNDKQRNEQCSGQRKEQGNEQCSGQRKENSLEGKGISCERDGAKQDDDQRKLLNEIEMLKKEKRILQLENEIVKLKLSSENKNVSDGKNTVNVPFDTLKELLPMYDGEMHVGAWIAQLKCVRDNYNVNDNNLRALICNKLKGKALQWLYSNPAYVTEAVDDLLNDLINMFGKRENILATRRKLENRIWQSGENFVKYYNGKVILSSALNVDDDEFIDYVIEGIPDVGLRNQAKLQRFSTRDALLQAFRDIELGSSTQRPASHGKVSYNSQRSANTQLQQQVEKRDVKCYNCNSKGHVAAECRKPKRQDGACFACGGFGHLAKDCDQYKKKLYQNEYNVS